MESSRNAAAALTQKLDHHLPEIKRRALDSLCFKLYNNLLTPSDFRDAVCSRPLVGVISRDREDVNTKASALDVLLLICADFFTAQSVSVCLDAAGLKDSDVGGPDLLRCQFRKLVDKLAEHSAEAQNVAPNVPPPGSALTWGSAAGSQCGIDEKGAHDGTDRSTDRGNLTGSAISQSGEQRKVLQESKSVVGFAGEQPRRGTPSLPALPASMLFSAPPQAAQAESKAVIAPSSPPIPVQSLSHSGPSAGAASHSQQPRPQQPLAPSSTHGSCEPQVSSLLNKLKSRTAASMLGGRVDSRAKPQAHAVPSMQDPLSYAHREPSQFSLHSSSEAHTAGQRINPKTGAYSADKAPFGGAGEGASGRTYSATPPAPLQPSAQGLVPSASSKSPHSGPLFQAMLEQSAGERAGQFAREESLAVAAGPPGASSAVVVSTISTEKRHQAPDDNRFAAGEARGAGHSRHMLPTGTMATEVDVQPRMLPQVALTSADEEALFGLTVRLQYAETELEVITGLQELAFCMLLDIPPAAILQRTTLLDTVLQLASSAASETAQRLAIHFLHSLVVQTKQALLHTADAEQCPLYDAFDGPSSTGDLHAEEEQLLKSYPQAEANKLPLWHDDAGAQLVDVDACLHSICTRATAMLSSTGQILCGTLSLLEVLLPLLRLECSAPHASLASGRLKEYMKGLSDSLEAHVIVPAAVSDPSEGAITPVEHAINQPLLLKHSGIEVSALIVRFLQHVPVAECSDVVPPHLQLRLAQLWCNPLMDVIAPSWRACVSPYLATLSPHCAQANAIAGHAEHAIESAEKMQKDAEVVLSGAVALSAWLENMPLALMATAFSPHKELVRTIIHTVVGTVAKQMEAGQGAASLLEIASDILQTLLQHPVATVAAKSWAVVTQLLQQLLGSSEQHRVLVQLLVNDSCMRFAFGRMLPHGHEGERESAVQLLAAAVTSEEEAIIEAFGKWRPWLECYISNPSLRHLSGTMPAVGHLKSLTSCHWDQLAVLLQRLYSKKSRKMCNDAARRLHSCVFTHAEVQVESNVREDPFRGLLDASTAMALADSGHEGRMDDLNMSDVHNLMACVCNASLPDAVRSSALQRLSSEVQEPAFLAAVAVPSFLEEVLQCVERCVAGLLGGNSAWCSETPTAIHSVQLCAYSLFLLGVLCCRSQGVLAWILGQTHRVIALLPLVFHPITVARRGMAVFLAPIVFLPPVGLMAQESQISSVQSATAPSITLFPVFHELYHMPLPVMELQLDQDFIQHCSAATAVPCGSEGAGCPDTVEFLSHEKHEVVQIIFFLLSAGRLVDECCPGGTAQESALRDSKQLQLRAMQECASRLRDWPSDHLLQDRRQQLMAFLQEAAPLGRLDAIKQHLEGRGGAARPLLLELCQSCSGAQLACGLESAMATCLSAVMSTPAQVPELTDWDAWISTLAQLLATRTVPGDVLLRMVEAAVPATVSLLARWSQSTPATSAHSNGNELHQDDDALHLMALPSQQEHHHAQPVLVTTLHFLAVLLQDTCIRCTIQQQVRILELMNGVDFIGLLLNSVLANTHVPRASHYAAGGCLCEIVRILDRVVSFRCSVRNEEGDVPAGSLDPCTEPLQQSLGVLLQHIIRQIGMSAQHVDPCTFLGRHMLRMGMRMLQSICSILPSERWSQDWVSAVGVFWLTKQLKAVDLRIRCQAAQLLCVIAHPTALQMRSTILQAWPEGGTFMMRHGLSRRQPPAFSAAALNFTATSMASSTVDVPVPEGYKAATAGVTEFGCEAVLSREFLWDGLLARMPACGRSPVLACSICMMLRIHASCAPHDTLDLLRRQGVPLDVLLQHLDIRQQMTSAATVDDGTCNDQAHDSSGFMSVIPQTRTSSTECLPRLSHQSSTQEEGVVARYYSDSGHASSQCRRAEALASCEQQADAVSWRTRMHRAAYGYQFLCGSGSSGTVSAIYSAGHVSAVLNCMLTTVSAHLTVDTTRVLEQVLCSIALACPAAACAYAPHTSAGAQENSTAASTAAVDMMQCACTLLSHLDMSSEDMQDVLSHVKSYARIDLCVALAHVLLAVHQIPYRLRRAAASLLHCFLGLPGFARPFLHSWQDKSELPCPASLMDQATTADSVPVGQALLVGLHSLASSWKAGGAPGDGARTGPQCRESTSNTQQAPDNRGVLESLLAQSPAATAFALAKGLHVSWAENLAVSLQGLGGSEHSQVAIDRTTVHKGASCASITEAVAWLSLLRAVAHKDSEAMSALAQAGVIETIHAHWNRVCGIAAVLREATLLLSTLVADSFDARHIISTASQPALLVKISRLLHQDGGNGIRSVACQLLCNFAAALDGTLTLLKSQIIPEVSKALQTALVRHDDALADRCLKIFSAVTSHSAGQRQLMRVQGLPPFLEIAADLPMQRMPLTGASLLLLLRNLAFLSDNKAYFLADPRILKLLARQCAAAEHSPYNAAYAMSALWALLHKGERVKATLKGIPDVISSIQACTNSSSQILQEAKSAGAPMSRLETLQQLQQSSQVVSRALGLVAQKTEN